MSTLEFNKNLDLLQEPLHAFAYSLTKNTEDAKDLYQETAYRAINNRDKFMEDTNFKAWTFTIMKNIFINNYRKKVRSNTMLDATEGNFFLNSGGEKVQNEGGRNMLMKELQLMIGMLDDSVRKPFLMHYEGFKYHEIAEELNLPLGTVKSRIFFARKTLKDKIGKLYGDLYLIRSMSA
jgi:RNA polymerase sigma-70 factor (ECF subfamily)